MSQSTYELVSLNVHFSFLATFQKLMSTKPSDPLAFFRSLPRSLHDDPSQIHGNLTLEQKQLCANVLSYFVVEGNVYGSDVGGRVRLVELNVWKNEGRGMQAQTVCEVEVEQGEILNGNVGYRDVFSIRVAYRYVQHLRNSAWWLCRISCGYVCLIPRVSFFGYL